MSDPSPLVAGMSPMNNSLVPPEAIVGREGELAALRAVLDAPSLLPTAVVIEGEAGVGKTTVWRAGVELARERGWRVLSSRPAEAETKLSFAALGDLLEDALDEVLFELREPQRHALEVALLRTRTGGVRLDRRAVSVASLSVVRTLAASRPTLLAIDDVQWLDPPSAAVLQFALRRLESERVALLFAVRTDHRGAPHSALAQPLPDERLLRLRLRPLSLGALHHLLATRLARALPRPLLRRIYETSKGNPLFALELARALAAIDDPSDLAGPLPVPDELRTLVSARLRRLPRATREALLVAASVPEPPVSLVTRASKAGLDPAVEAQIVEVHEGRIRFVHPLFASAVYASADDEHRRRTHRRLAKLVHDPEARARHLALAATAPDEETASALETAAARARARGGADTAVELAEQAVGLTAPDRPNAIVRRRIAASGYALEAGDTSRARRLLQLALDAAPEAATRSRALVELARVRSLESDLRAAASHFREVLAMPESDVTAQVDAHKGLATTLFRLRENLTDAERHAEAATRLAETLGDEAKLADVLSVHGLVACIRGKPRARALLDRALELAPHTRDLGILSQPAFHDAVVRMWTDDLDGAATTFRRLRDRADEIGDESALPYLLAFLAFVDFLRGALAAADRYVDEGRDAAAQASQEAQGAFLLSTRALVEAYRGNRDAAREASERAKETAARTGAAIAEIQTAWALGSLALLGGEANEACAILTPLADRLESAGVREPGTMRFLPDLIEALMVLGRLEEAERRIASLTERAAELDRTSARAAAARCSGLLHAARGDLDAAFAAFEGALEAHEAVDVPLERARTLLALGAAQRRAKRKRAARQSLEEAHGVFAEASATAWAERAQAELAQVGGRAPSRGELTPTERRVAALVAEGRTNREVASVLFLSDRTVEFHLTRIYAKLGVRSRSELARSFADRRVATTLSRP